jgi:hypothetical protein
MRIVIFPVALSIALLALAEPVCRSVALTTCKAKGGVFCCNNGKSGMAFVCDKGAGSKNIQYINPCADSREVCFDNLEYGTLHCKYPAPNAGGKLVRAIRARAH